MLAGSAEAQLRTMADTPGWRTMHLLMLAGSGLLIAGIWVRLVTDRSMSGIVSPSAAGAFAGPVSTTGPLIAG